MKYTVVLRYVTHWLLGVEFTWLDGDPFVLERKVWEAMGQPKKITVTIEPTQEVGT